MTNRWSPLGLAGSSLLQCPVQQPSQPDPGLLQLEFDHQVRVPLIGGRDRGWILAAQVPVSDRLRQPVPLQDPILDAALDPLGPVLCRDMALQLRRKSLRFRLMCSSSPVPQI